MQIIRIWAAADVAELDLAGAQIRRHCARSPRTAPIAHCDAVSGHGLIVAHRIDAVRAAVVRGLAARQA